MPPPAAGIADPVDPSRSATGTAGSGRGTPGRANAAAASRQPRRRPAAPQPSQSLSRRPRHNPYAPAVRTGQQYGGHRSNPYLPGTVPVAGRGGPDHGRRGAAGRVGAGVSLAVVLDNIIVSIVASLLTFRIWHSDGEAFTTLLRQAAAGVLDRSGPGQPDLQPAATSVTLILTVTLAVGLVYHAGFLRWQGATLGKLACRLRVVPVDRGRNTATAGLVDDRDPGAICLLPSASTACSTDLPADRRPVPALAAQAAGPARSGRQDPGGEAGLTRRGRSRPPAGHRVRWTSQMPCEVFARRCDNVRRLWLY